MHERELKRGLEKYSIGRKFPHLKERKISMHSADPPPDAAAAVCELVTACTQPLQEKSMVEGGQGNVGRLPPLTSLSIPCKKYHHHHQSQSQLQNLAT